MAKELKDQQTGIAIRFIQSFDPNKPERFDSMFDKALMLVMGDERDIPTAEKLADALTFLRMRVH